MASQTSHIADFLKDIPKQSEKDSDFFRRVMDNWLTVPDSDIDKVRRLLKILPPGQKICPCRMPHCPDKYGGFLIKGGEEHYCIVIDPFYYGDDPK